MRPPLVAISLVTVLAPLAAIASPAAAAPTNFNITNSGMSAFVVDGVNNPTLTLTRGQTYIFTIITVNGESHPFWITTARGAGDVGTNAFNDGVTGNGASPGTITFVVPPSAPPTLFYQCAFHDPMGGTLTIVSAPPPPVPSSNAGSVAALGLLLLGVGFTALRRRGNG